MRAVISEFKLIFKANHVHFYDGGEVYDATPGSGLLSIRINYWEVRFGTVYITSNDLMWNDKLFTKAAPFVQDSYQKYLAALILKE